MNSEMFLKKMIYLSLTFISFQRVESIKCRTLEFNLIILKNPKNGCEENVGNWPHRPRYEYKQDLELFGVEFIKE